MLKTHRATIANTARRIGHRGTLCLDEALYLCHHFLSFRPSHRIYTAHLPFFLFGSSNGERVLRINEEDVTLPFLFFKVRQLFVVHQVAARHRLHYGGVLSHKQMEERHELRLLLEKAFGLRQDNDVSFKALPLEITKRDGVADAAIEQEPAIEVDGLRHQRHGGRGAYPFHSFVVNNVQFTIDRFAR